MFSWPAPYLLSAFNLLLPCWLALLAKENSPAAFSFICGVKKTEQKVGSSTTTRLAYPILGNTHLWKHTGPAILHHFGRLFVRCPGKTGVCLKGGKKKEKRLRCGLDWVLECKARQR